MTASPRNRSAAGNHSAGKTSANQSGIDTSITARRRIRCAIYTRKSSEDGLEQEFNSLDAQREASEAYILSQKHDGWVAIPDFYDDGGQIHKTTIDANGVHFNALAYWPDLIGKIINLAAGLVV